MRRRKACRCLLCRPVEGRRAHAKYGYDLDLARRTECLMCHAVIGDEPYVEILDMARFGTMQLAHQRCETAEMARDRARLEGNWDRRPERTEVESQ
jgi:hypothetical protein